MSFFWRLFSFYSSLRHQSELIAHRPHNDQESESEESGDDHDSEFEESEYVTDDLIDVASGLEAEEFMEDLLEEYTPGAEQALEVRTSPIFFFFFFFYLYMYSISSQALNAGATVQSARTISGTACNDNYYYYNRDPESCVAALDEWLGTAAAALPPDDFALLQSRVRSKRYGTY